MKNFISNVKNFFNTLKSIFKFKPKVIEEYIYENEKFQNYLENVDILDPAYDDIKKAVELSEEAIYLAEKRISLSNKLENSILKENDLEKFNSFNKESLQKLQNYIEAYRIAFKESNVLKTQINSYDKSLDYLAKYENEVETILKEIEYSEQRQAGLKRDIAYITGEKEDLIYGREQLQQALKFLYGFSIVFVCTLAIITFVLGVLKITYDMEIFVPLMVLCVFAIILGSATYIFQRKFRHELHRNQLLQVKVIELLNRAKVLYVNCTSFLNYEYKKYRVRNSMMLKNNWDEYMYQKQISRRHIAMNNRSQEVVGNIIKMLSNAGIENPDALFEELLNLVSMEDKKLLYKDISDERKNIENELNDLDNKQQKLWNELTNLQNTDKTENKVISNIIQTYEEELNKLISNLEPE